MSASHPRRWTAGRQLRFLDELAQTRSITRAADAAGMSRESAYRLRARRDGALFGALWDRACKTPLAQGHSPGLGSGTLMRLLGTHYRRKRGDFAGIGAARSERRAPQSDANFVTRRGHGDIDDT